MFSGAAQEVLFEQAKRFMEENPEVEVNIIWTDYASLHENMTELAGAAGKYNVMAVVTDFMPEFISSGYLEPSMPLLKMIPEGWPDSFPDSLLRYQKDAEGKIYGLPWWDGPVMFLLSKSLFEDPIEKKISKINMGTISILRQPGRCLDIAQFFTRDANQDGIMNFMELFRGTAGWAKLGI